MKVRCTNGTSFGVKYTITSDDVNTPAVAEIVTLEVTAVATLDGDISITLPSLAGVDVAVVDTDDLAGIATKIKATTFTGWTTGGTGTIVTFTKNVAGAVTGTPEFDGGTTGVTATIAVTTNGADEIDNVVEFDFSIGNTFRYMLVANVNIYNAGVLTNPVDLSITYPSNGRVRVNGTLVEGHVIHLIAQRDSLA